MSVITESMVERAWRFWANVFEAETTPTHEWRRSKEAMRAALESVEGSFEQRFENDQVRRMQREGHCPCCGAGA